IFTEGNFVIDQAVAQPLAAVVNPEPPVTVAHRSHKFFHQSARALQKEFGITRAQARAVIAACPDCARVMTLQDQGTNPRGLQPRGVWQTDVTDFPSFGRLRHVHVTVDTCSRAVWATPA
ncbi:POK8 protein, partial [Ibidorhyncha struthersii]|nr:POK8 protein [Ibidorhyncha struthersii]